MSDQKSQLSEGLLTSIVDNFFKSLQKGVANKYIDAAKKAGVHPDVANAMKKVDDDWNELQKALKNNHNY